MTEQIWVCGIFNIAVVYIFKDTWQTAQLIMCFDISAKACGCSVTCFAALCWKVIFSAVQLSQTAMWHTSWEYHEWCINVIFPFILFCVHVLASFVHITKANVKRFFSKFHAQCDVNILQELKIYGCTAATFHWCISWNHSFILPDVLEMVVVIKKKKNLYGTNIHKQQSNVKNTTTIYKHIYIYILYILLVSTCDKKN